MASSRRFPRRRGGSGRQRTTWNNHALTFSLGTAGVLVFSDLTPVPLNVGDEKHGTAVCKRLIMHFSARQADPVGNTPQNFGVGIGIISQQALAQLEILAPLSTINDNQDWYYWTGRSTFRDTNDNLAPNYWDADIRSQRRLRAGYSLVMSIEPESVNTTNLTITASVRALWAISN